MIINIDVEGLTQKKKALESELEKINSMLSLIQAFSTQTAQPPVPSLGVRAQRNGDKRRSLVAGKRKAVTMALSTGPATESEVAAVVGWEVQEVIRVITPMLHCKLCYLNQFGKLELSPEGKKQAAWFVAHPRYTVYVPQKAGQ